MKNNLSLWQFGGFALTSLGGTLLHFLYDWTNESLLIAPFSGVNESTWEHMKLLFFPLFLFALVQSRFFKESKNFWCIKLKGAVTGLLTIPVLFYTYNGTFGKSPDFINITIFFIAAAVTFIVETRAFNRSTSKCRRPLFAFSILLIIGLLFIIFTFITPRIPIFQDPLTNTFGLNK